MLGKKRLLYLTANRLTAYSLKRGKLEVDAAFERNDEGVAGFSRYLAKSGHLYYLVIDVVEEDYHQDSIPQLGRKDRRLVLARKLAQRYRDTSLTLSLSLGVEKGERHNEKVLYAAFSNTQQFQPWLSALGQAEVKLVGVYSTALLAPALLAGAALKAPRCLLVSVQQTGVRQTYVEDGKIRFSRVGRLSLEDDATVAATCAGESARLQQYLVTMRVLPAANTPMDVMVLAPERYQPALLEACRNSEALRFHIVNANAQCRKVGLPGFPAEAPCDALFLHAAATATPADQFAQEQQRHLFRLWQFGNYLYAGGLAMLVAGLAVAAVDLFSAHGLRQQLEAEQAKFSQLSGDYARVTATFPKTPTSTENLKTTIRQYQTLRSQSATPALLLGEISKVLANFPQVEIERIDWHVGKPSAEGAAKPAAGKPGAPASEPPVDGAPKPGTPADADKDYQFAVVTARIVGVRRSDVRAITEMANQFIATFRRIPRMEVLGSKLPFDVTASDTLGGSIGSERTVAEDANFSVTIARRLGA